MNYSDVLKTIRGDAVTGLINTYPVTINFHPDRLTGDKRPILQVLQYDGRLKSQFETATSNGGLSAFVGGDRWLWEHKAFAGFYDNCQPEQRPIYGALNIKNSAVGASPRFGSAHFILNKSMLTRSSFCFPDSCFNPGDFATVEGIGKLIALAKTTDLDILDSYIEAHIHGGIQLESDVDALVLDPSFQGTEIEEFASHLPCRLEWHQGFAVEVSELWQHETYRGREIVELAHALAPDNGILRPSDLSLAHTQGTYHPQSLKKVWHYLARFSTNHPQQ